MQDLQRLLKMQILRTQTLNAVSPKAGQQLKVDFQESQMYGIIICHKYNGIVLHTKPEQWRMH